MYKSIENQLWNDKWHWSIIISRGVSSLFLINYLTYVCSKLYSKAILLTLKSSLIFNSQFIQYIGTRFSWSYLPGLRKGPHAEAEAVVDVNYQLFQQLAGNQFCISCSVSCLDGGWPATSAPSSRVTPFRGLSFTPVVPFIFRVCCGSWTGALF